MFSQLESLSPKEEEKLYLLRDHIKRLESVCVAYSGGVDSSLIAAIAYEQLNKKALAVTGVSPSLAPYLLNEARAQARWIGIHHEECITEELSDPNYNKNPTNRCFACKKELHKKLKKFILKWEGKKIIDGVNLDDLGEYRPGIKAANEAGVISPLANCQINKSSIRNISKALGLPWWDKPSQPCLASRVPYGEKISSKRLQQIGLAEQWLIKKGFKEVRVRNQGTAARIELPKSRIADLINNHEHSEIVKYFLSIGFNSVSIDLEGLISGKLNRDLNSKSIE